MSNFNKVEEFHKRFEHKVNKQSQLNLFIEDPKLVDLRLKLIEEEFTELKDAVKTNNFVEVADALTDLLYVIYGAGHSFGIDLDKSFDLVHKSNMSKLANSEKEAQETCEWYKERNNNFKPEYKKTKDNKKWMVFDANTGKTLKSKYYNQVDLSYLLTSKR